jgi:hypothetical protein
MKCYFNHCNQISTFQVATGIDNTGRYIFNPVCEGCTESIKWNVLKTKPLAPPTLEELLERIIKLEARPSGGENI